MIKYSKLIVICLLVFVLPGCAIASEWTVNDADRVVAISDVHGAYDGMIRTLQNAGIIGEDLSWSGDTSHLVIAGDLLDRGPESRKAMDLLMRLEGEANAAGGRVHVLIGNHEAMNLIGDLRYVSRAEYAAFASEETAEERARWFAALADRDGIDELSRAGFRADFDARYPPGFFAHRRAFASDGSYGAWLLEKPVIVVINGTAFVHGGISPMIAELGLEGVNGELMDGLRTLVKAATQLVASGDLLPTDAYRDHADVLGALARSSSAPAESVAAANAVISLGESDLHASDGPLWYRGNIACSQLIEEDRLRASLETIGAERVVIGHTPTPGRRILQRMDGRVLEVDTGMLSDYYGGAGNALILQGGSIATVSESSAEMIAPAEHPRRVGARPGEALSAAELEHLLMNGEIVAITESDIGRKIVRIHDGDNTVDALFAKRDGRNFYTDVAAYRLDRMLKLDMVPVSVIRKLGDDDGSLQFLPNKWQDEQQRGASGRGGSAQCALDAQWGAMYVFDALIYNEGRSLQRMLYSPDIWQLVLVGHNRAFSTKKGVPRHLALIPLAIGDAWKDALQALSDDNLEEQLGDVLDKRRRRALLARRDALIQ